MLFGTPQEGAAFSGREGRNRPRDPRLASQVEEQQLLWKEEEKSSDELIRFLTVFKWCQISPYWALDRSTSPQHFPHIQCGISAASFHLSSALETLIRHPSLALYSSQ
jgi:hypothetical protein